MADELQFAFDDLTLEAAACTPPPPPYPSPEHTATSAPRAVANGNRRFDDNVESSPPLVVRERHVDAHSGSVTLVYGDASSSVVVTESASLFFNCTPA